MMGYYERKSAHMSCSDCPWTGLGTDLQLGEVFGEVAEYNCPGCGTKVISCAFPTYEEIRAAAEAGDAEAQEQLVSVERARERAARVDASKQVPVSAPAALDEAEEIRAVLRLEDAEDDVWLVLSANDLELHRELAYYEDFEPARRFLQLLEKRYGSRLLSFDCYGAVTYLCGDRIGCVRELAALVSHLPERDGRSTSTDTRP